MTGPESDTPAPGPSRWPNCWPGTAPSAPRRSPGRRRRRRGDSDAVTVAELTGEIPLIRDAAHVAVDEPADKPADRAGAGRRGIGAGYRGGARSRLRDRGADPTTAVLGRRPSRAGPSRNRSRTARRDRSAASTRGRCATTRREAAGQSGAEEMSPDPVDHYANAAVDVMDSEVREGRTGDPRIPPTCAPICGIRTRRCSAARRWPTSWPGGAAPSRRPSAEAWPARGRRRGPAEAESRP